MTKIPFIWSEYENFSGVDFNLIYKKVEKDSKGVNIAGGINYLKDSKGVNVSVLANRIERYSKGADIAGLLNYAGKVDGFLIQYGTLSNNVHEASDDSFVLQIGLSNQIEDKYAWVMNIKGLKNFPKQFKNLFTKKNLEKKVLQVQIKRY